MNAGEPWTVSPSFKFLPIPDCAWIFTPSPITKCPAKPTWPPIKQFLPILVVPAIPVWAAITVFSPISTLWATWMWLSYFTPFLMIVQPKVALSTVVHAPISTSSSIITFPICGTFT